MRLSLLVLLAVLSAACASLHDVEVAHAHGDGTTRLYDVPADRALVLARTVLEHEGASTVVDASQPGGLLAIVEGRVFPPRYGATCGVWVEAQDATHARVTVVTKRERGTWAAGLSEGTFQDDFARAVVAR
jgi:hypothetical protein